MGQTKEDQGMATAEHEAQNRSAYRVHLTIYRRVPVNPSWIILFGWFEALVAEGLIPDDPTMVEFCVTQRVESNAYKARTDVEVYEL